MSPTVFQPLEQDDPREVGGYRITARLGAGVMGRVFLASTRSGRRLAVKVIRPEFAGDPEFRRRLRQEVGAAQRVRSPFVAPLVDADTEGPECWLATAHVPGPSLAQAVAEHGPLDLGTVRPMIAGVAAALQAVHAAGVIHRELKPSNVLLAGDGPRVIDFGVARAADATPLTRTGVRVGTPRFMAPEQAAGRPFTPAIDMFALGNLIHFAVTGRSPFGDGHAAAALHRIAREDPDLDGCPPELRPLVARCLAKNPEERPRPAEILAEFPLLAPGTAWLPPTIVGRLSSYDPALAQAPSSVPAERRRRVGRRLAIAAAGLAIILAAALVIVRSGQAEANPPPRRTVTVAPSTAETPQP